MFSFLFTLSYEGHCQYEFIEEERIVGQILDTLEVNNNNVVVNTLWSNDTLRVVVQNKHLKFDLKTSNKEAYDEKRFFSISERKAYIKSLKAKGQNCYSYVLENYLGHNKMAQQSVFNKQTLIDLETLGQILSHYFMEVKAFNTLSKKNFKTNLPDNTILTFLNQADMVIHAVYYDKGRFYTKEADYEATEFINLRHYLKDYHEETHMIKIYQLDKARLALAFGK